MQVYDSKLPADRQTRAVELIGVVRQYQDAAAMVMAALEEIKSDKLYVELGYKSWTAFSEGELKLSRQRADQIILESRSRKMTNAFVIDSEASPSVPVSGRALREIATLSESDPEAAAEVLSEVAASGPVTAPAVREAVQRRTQPETPHVETLSEKAERTACVNDCGHYQARHVLFRDGHYGPCRECTCTAYVAPGTMAPRPPAVEPEPAAEPVVVSDTRFLRLVRDLHVELNRPECALGIVSLARQPEAAFEAAAQVMALCRRLEQVADALISGAPPESAAVYYAEVLPEREPVTEEV